MQQKKNYFRAVYIFKQYIGLAVLPTVFFVAWYKIVIPTHGKQKHGQQGVGKCGSTPLEGCNHNTLQEFLTKVILF